MLDSGRPPVPPGHADIAFLTRRQLLAGAGAGLALSALGLPSVWAQDEDTASAEIFMARSHHLTGRKQLNPILGQRLLQALQQNYENFEPTMLAVAEFVQQHSQLPVAELPAVLQEQQPELAAVPQQIISAWYLGQIGQVSPESSDRRGQASKEPTPSGVAVLSYEQALMFDPVRDVLTIPSYCRDLPGYWAQQPA